MPAPPFDLRIRCIVSIAFGTLLLMSAPGCDPPAAPPQMGPPKVTWARPLTREVVEWDRYTGRIEAIERVDIRPRVSGYLKELTFREGSIVKQGQKLCVIDPRPFEAEVEKATAERDAALARQQQAIKLKLQAEAEKLQLAARDLLTQKRVKRAEELYQERSISEEELEIRQTEAVEATANLRAADARIAAAAAAVKTAEAGVTTARANLDAAELELGYTVVRAPFRGRIGERRITVGNLVSAADGQSSVISTLVSIDPIHCVFDADTQAYMKYTRLAEQGERKSSRQTLNPVYLRLVDEKKFKHRGHMDFVDNSIDKNTATIRGRAIFRNPDDLLTDGLFAKVRIPGSNLYEATFIPDSAIGRDQSKTFVMVVTDGNTVERKDVVLGARMFGQRIVKGLSTSDRVVISGLQRIQPKMKVTATEGNFELGEEDFAPTDVTPFEKPIEQTSNPILPSGPSEEGDDESSAKANPDSAAGED